MRGETGFAEGEYILRPFVPGVKLTLDMFSSKSTFAGGETYLQINSDTMERRFDEGTGETVGVYRIELEIPEDEDSYCFRYTLDQHSNHGTRVSMPRANNGYVLNFDVRDVVTYRGDTGAKFHVTTQRTCLKGDGKSIEIYAITPTESRAPHVQSDLEDLKKNMYVFRRTPQQYISNLSTIESGAGRYSLSWRVKENPRLTATSTNTITIVEVDYLEYKLDGVEDAEWTRVEESDPIYVIKGQKVEFRAFPYPDDKHYPGTGVWPSGKPVWSGSSGTTGTRSTSSATFETTSSAKDDYKTAIAECGNEKTANVVVVGIDIEWDGDVITDKEAITIIGAKIALKGIVAPEGLTLTNKKWTIPGNAIKNWTANKNASSLTLLAAEDYQGGEITFYWIEGSDSHEVKYTVTIDGTELEGKATFEVKTPTATVTANTGPITIGAPLGYLELYFGNWNTLTPGISFSRSITVPHGYIWETQWVQLAYPSRRRVLNDGKKKSWGTSGLDTKYPYSYEPLTDDSPGTPLSKEYLKVSVDERFDMFLMFRPIGGLWVPLKRIHWGWSATARRDGSNWILDGSNIVEPSVSNTSKHPAWTVNASSSTWQ